MDEINYDMLPEHCRKAVKGYIEEGSPMGHFLTAVFENDLAGSAALADEKNGKSLLQYGKFLNWYVPSICWGDRLKIRKWINAGGLKGIIG